MNRVTKKFLGKVLPPIGFMFYFAAVMFGAAVVPGIWTIVVPVVFLIIPLLGFMFYESYKDAVKEVEWEDRDLINTLKENA